MGVKSLVELCTKVALENIARIESLQNMPVKATQEILSGIRSAVQLRNLEGNDEELRELTAPHWQRLIRKDFPLLDKQYNWVPKRPEEWHKVYKKYQDLQTQQDAEATAKLQAAFAAQKKQADSRQASLVSFKDTWKLPRLPKDGGSSFGGFRSQPWGASSGSSGSGSGSGSTPRPRDGKGFLQKARREARDLHNRHSSALIPGRMAASRQITRAPQAMLDAKRIERQYDPVANHANAPTIRVPRAISTNNDQEDHERREREARLLSIKTGSKPTPGNVISFDDDVDDEDDDIFGDKKAYSSVTGGVDGSSPPSSPDFATTTPRKSGLKRRAGLLSAAPGANAGSGTFRTVKGKSIDSDATSPTSPRPPRGTPTKFASIPRPTASAPKYAVKSNVSNSSSASGDLAEESSSSTMPSTDRAALERMKRKPASSALFVPKKRPRI